MNKRKWIISISGLLLVILAIVLIKLLPESKPKVQRQNGELETAVNTLTYKAVTIQSTYDLSGRIVPEERIDLFAEVGGKAMRSEKAFKSGTLFKKGELLLRIDDREFRNALKAQKSEAKSLLAAILADVKLDFPDQYDKWEKFLKSIDIQKEMPELPETDDQQFELFLAGRNVISRYYQIKEAEVRLGKYNITAPFDGALTAAYIDQGALVRVGQPLGEFISSSEFELEASVELDLLSQLKIGDTLEFRAMDTKEAFYARLMRINQKIDPSTQLIKVYFKLSDQRLKAGRFLQGKYESEVYEDAMRIPAQALVEENKVFLVVDQRAQLKEIELLQSNTNEAVIRGLENGDKLIVDSKNSAFEGSKIIEIDRE